LRIRTGWTFISGTVKAILLIFDSGFHFKTVAGMLNIDRGLMFSAKIILKIVAIGAAVS
tara:strand:+ start:1856 stop:2032 length:177 start_codon:yes stop_codon:yes gene_type:complete